MIELPIFTCGTIRPKYTGPFIKARSFCGRGSFSGIEVTWERFGRDQFSNVDVTNHTVLMSSRIISLMIH